ncbi:MAG: hypothetical protein KAH93_01830 [Candidatus Aenigmarchaeota archaeon]|nr:hypothetical protein [Candidatus Aenigmarchaeota archaeon]
MLVINDSQHSSLLEHRYPKFKEYLENKVTEELYLINYFESTKKSTCSIYPGEETEGVFKLGDLVVRLEDTFADYKLSSQKAVIKTAILPIGFKEREITLEYDAIGKRRIDPYGYIPFP